MTFTPQEIWNHLRIIYSNVEKKNKVVYITPFEKVNEISENLRFLFQMVYNEDPLEFGSDIGIFSINPNDPDPEESVELTFRGTKYDVFVHPDVQLTPKMKKAFSECAIIQKPEFKI